MTTTSDKLPMMLTLADEVPGPKQGQWTYRDYAALDDEQHYEIVNGVLLMTPAPSWSHQEVVLEIASYLRTYVRTTGLGGVFTAPIDVELSPKDVFQPDVVVLLKESREKLRERHIVGAPDLVVEVRRRSRTKSVQGDRPGMADRFPADHGEFRDDADCHPRAVRLRQHGAARCRICLTHSRQAPTP